LFGPLYTHVDEYVEIMKRLQDDLGEANDVETADKYVRRLAKNGDDPRAAAAGKHLIEWHEDRIADHEPRAARRMQQFLATTPFWRQ
jgi:CHAD domain-containing protein